MDPATIVLIILGAAAVLFVTEIVPLPVTAMLVPIALNVTGVISAQQAFENFGNKWVILFMAMFIVGDAIFRTGLAGQLNISVAPLLMGVAMAASCCFLTPMATPPNTIVLGPGGYRFRHCAKAGWPLQIISFVVAMVIIPLVWPF